MISVPLALTVFTKAETWGRNYNHLLEMQSKYIVFPIIAETEVEGLDTDNENDPEVSEMIADMQSTGFEAIAEGLVDFVHISENATHTKVGELTMKLARDMGRPVTVIPEDLTLPEEPIFKEATI